MKSRRTRSTRRISVTSWKTARVPARGPALGKRAARPQTVRATWPRISMSSKTGGALSRARDRRSSTAGQSDQLDDRPVRDLAPDREELAKGRVHQHDPLVRVEHEHALDHLAHHRFELLHVSPRPVELALDLVRHAVDGTGQGIPLVVEIPERAARPASPWRCGARPRAISRGARRPCARDAGSRGTRWRRSPASSSDGGADRLDAPGPAPPATRAAARPRSPRRSARRP